uniref:Transferase 2, rSAM/selenodomain-associated n=1 Tax=Candidatus Kentrum sp. MB TaxID=2138164 RepID=A0A450XST1_9GAMM|nr:MAG: transferase 2, rSAM/selenodomain-associated [Candidatus Kentron sp. MB]VFK75832.1 MAG: transferase 2, rSAM/selenodomain-associated [Candidatus Kentron sp. MB]
MAQHGIPLSIILPARDEAPNIVRTLLPLQGMRGRGAEVMVVDGGSQDDTVRCAEPLADRVLMAEPGRARQMNAGAALARGEVLWFLHADTIAPANADRLVLDALTHGYRWGRFPVRLSGQGRYPLLRLVAQMMNARSCVTGIATGDQGIFVARRAFERVGGFPDIPLMEDIQISRGLKRSAGRPACLTTPLTTNSRRWEENGIARTILFMWGLRLAFFFGVSPARLARHYHSHGAHDGAESL